MEAITAHAFESDSGTAPVRIAETVDQARRLVPAVDASFGAVFDRSAERIFLIDETGREIRPDQALLLFLHLISLSGGKGAIAVPITATSQVEEVVGDRFEVVRTQASLAGLTQAATAEGIVFAGAPGGGYVFPGFLPAYDAIASLCKLLELLASVEQPMSQLVSQLPRPTLIHRQVQCPWALKGTVMRVLNERYADGDVDVTRRDQDLRRTRLGAGAPGRRRAGDPPLRRGRHDGILRRPRRRAPNARHGRDRAGGDRRALTS